MPVSRLERGDLQRQLVAENEDQIAVHDRFHRAEGHCSKYALPAVMDWSGIMEPADRDHGRPAGLLSGAVLTDQSIIIALDGNNRKSAAQKRRR